MVSGNGLAGHDCVVHDNGGPAGCHPPYRFLSVMAMGRHLQPREPLAGEGSADEIRKVVATLK